MPARTRVFVLHDVSGLRAALPVQSAGHDGGVDGGALRRQTNSNGKRIRPDVQAPPTKTRRGSRAVLFSGVARHIGVSGRRWGNTNQKWGEL